MKKKNIENQNTIIGLCGEIKENSEYQSQLHDINRDLQ